MPVMKTTTQRDRTTDTMVLPLRWAAVLLVGFSAAAGIGHALELVNKRSLDSQEYLVVQQRLYEGFGQVLGPVELLALAATVLLAVAFPHDRFSRVSTAAAGWLVLAALFVWQVWVGPTHTAVDTWTPQSIPDSWVTLRDHWEYGHAARAALYSTAFILLLAPALSRYDRDGADTTRTTHPSRTLDS